MNLLRPLLSCLAACLLSVAASSAEVTYSADLGPDGELRLSRAGVGSWSFRPEFTVLLAPKDPKLAMRPGGIERVSYNVPTWVSQGEAGGAALRSTVRSAASSGDGFDDRILKGDTAARTADVFASAPARVIKATGWERRAETIRYAFADDPDFTFSVVITLVPGVAEPVLAFTLTPKAGGWFSVGYTGAPRIPQSDADEFWQPFLWQEKRFPKQSFMTPGFQCPIPTTFVRRGESVLGVVVDSSEFPFDPLPLLENSRFGVALRTPDGSAQPMVFAPILGGAGSRREAGESFTFKLRLYVGPGEATIAYEEVARRLYGFRDYRSNAISSLNETLDRMIDYGMGKYSWFIDELKGCAYSTDVPGAVKNVSALNPLNLALVADDERIFNQRAYPIAEYLLSREKFLFSLDPKQRIQSPSRRLTGPAAPISELAALYGITHGASPVLRRLAERELGRSRTLNLDDVSPGNTWQSNLHVYRATGESRLLERARKGADAYLASRMASGASDLSEGGLFFWTAFTPDWIDLLELYEATQDVRYLEAARLGARRFTMFTWMAPTIPDEQVTVNPGGNAPHYWYLKSKGHKRMHAPEEKVPAWRLSEIGLTPESSGTMSGHRAIFMANHAPWMLQIAALTGDRLLHDVARSAVIGRYRNFPGYHMNTARTTIYEQADYPLRDHMELSVNSFHYNHIWPHMSILLDFLVTDAFARSRGEIDFPSRFIEGYAYLRSKFYGDRPGRFHGYEDAILWMPQHLLKPGSVELNYIAARGDGRVYLAFANQSRAAVETEVKFNAEVLPAAAMREYRARVIVDGRPSGEINVKGGKFPLTVSAMGQTAVIIEGLAVTPRFQDRLVSARANDAWTEDYLELPWGDARAMVLNFGPAASTAFIYLRDDDSKFKAVKLAYTVGNETKEVLDSGYPFEFTVPLPPGTTTVKFQLTGEGVDGRSSQSGWATFRK